MTDTAWEKLPAAARRCTAMRSAWACPASTWPEVDNAVNQLIYSVAEQISELSEAFELIPGDIIYAGTP